ncbi:hypothetical protein F4803DRAFT_4830 [Xylaria telfairii]|nr:hypothetical protein F4803DRAFT_4830 [Xylaria telfairii]
MEVAGLVLGALPIATCAVESYIKALKPIGSYKDYLQTMNGIRRNLFIQEQQLQVTLENIGLLKPTLSEIRQRLHQVNPGCSSQFVDILEHMDSITSSLMDKLEIDSNGKPKWTDEAPERVSWEWRRVKRSFGDKYRKELFDELQYWNTALKNCLEPKREIPSDRADPLTTELVTLFNFKSCDETRENARIIHEALEVAWSNCPDHQHPSNVELTWQQSGLKETGRLHLSVPEFGGNGEGKHWQKIFISIDAEQIHSTSGCNAVPNLPLSTKSAPNSTSAMPTKRKLRSTSGLREFFLPNLKIGNSAARKQVMSLQLESLGSCQSGLPDSQLITGLCNLIRQEDWNGHLLHADTANEKVIYMKRVLSPCSRFSKLSLESIISDSYCKDLKGKQVINVRLSRKERLGVAAAAVWAVLVLCGTPWLEESWLGKEDISLLVEVPTQGNGFGRPKTYPSLSHTFTPQQETTSQRVGNHYPDNNPQFPTRHKTLFALGILLIELGLNKAFHQIRADTNTGDPIKEASVQDDYMTAKKVIDSEALELELGESYANAVQRCIQCHFLGPEYTQSFLHSGFRKQFFIGVVAPVQATFDAQITSVIPL